MSVESKEYQCITCLGYEWDRDSVGSIGTGVMDDCDLPCCCWESYSDTFQQHVLWNAQPSVQPCLVFSLISYIFQWLLTYQFWFHVCDDIVSYMGLVKGKWGMACT